MRWSATLPCVLALLVLASCTGGIKIAPVEPLVAGDLEPYASARVVVLDFRSPEGQPGVGDTFAAELHRRLLQGGPFGQVDFRPDSSPFGLQSTQRQELASAAAMGAEMGFGLAVTGRVERFVYSRGSDSFLDVSVWIIDTVSGEIVRADRLSAHGFARTAYVAYDPGLSSGPAQDDIFASLAVELVRRLRPQESGGRRPVASLQGTKQ